MKLNVLNINMSDLSFCQIVLALYDFSVFIAVRSFISCFNQGTDVELMKCQKLHHDHKTIYCGRILILGFIYRKAASILMLEC